MTIRHWLKNCDQTVLFIMDAANETEINALHNWIERETTEAGFSGETRTVMVELGENPEKSYIQDLVFDLYDLPEALLIPVRVIWRNNQNAQSSPGIFDLISGKTRRPGAGRAESIYRKRPERIQCIAGKAALLSELKMLFKERESYSPTDELLAFFIADKAGIALDIEERHIIGNRYKVPRRVAENLKVCAQFKSSLAKLNYSGDQFEKQYHKISGELFAKPNHFWIDWFAALNRKTLSSGYEGQIAVNDERIEEIRQIILENPSALLWTHKTGVDGMTILSLLFEKDFPATHTLRNKKHLTYRLPWLRMLAKRAGTIFLSDKSQRDPLYNIVLHEYLGYLLRKRFPLTWAFEAGNARVGKLMPPSYDTLRQVMEAVQSSAIHDFYIIPVAINYDFIVGVDAYVDEQSNQSETPVSIRKFLSYLRRPKQSLGKIYLDFGNPVVFRETDSLSDSLAVEKTAFQIGVETNRVTPVTLPSLISMILLGASPASMGQIALQQACIEIVRWLAQNNLPLTQDLELVKLETQFSIPAYMLSSGLVEQSTDQANTTYRISAGKEGVAAYYRNTIVHHFVPKAIAELALLAAANDFRSIDDFWKQAEQLRDVFKHEFFYAPSEQYNEEINKIISSYDPLWEQKISQDQTYATRLLKRMKPLVSHRCLQQIVEAYQIVAECFSQLPDTESIDQKTCTKSAFQLAQTALTEGNISSAASTSHTLFGNAYKLFNGLGLNAVDDAEIAVKREAEFNTMKQITACLQEISQLASDDVATED